MAAGQGTVTIRILGDAKSLKSALGESDNALAGFSSKMQATSQKMMAVGAKMSAAVTLPIVALGKVAFDAASSLNEQISKVGVVFGENAGVIEAWSKNSAKSMGMSQKTALEAAGAFGTLFKTLGVTADHAGMLSTDLVQLASDLASFNDANPEDVLLALKAGLVGEVEPLRKFGVSLSATRVEAEALSMGLVRGEVNAEKFTQAQISLEKAQVKAAQALKSGGEESLAYRDAAADVATAEARLTEQIAGKVPELTAAQKAQAAYSVIMKDTALAQGDYSRTADSAANKQRTLTAMFDNAAASIGNKLMPVAMKLMEWAEKLVTSFDKLSPKMQNIILIGLGVAAVIGPLVGVIGAVVSVVGALSKALAFLAANPVVLIVAAVAALVAGLVYLYFHSDAFRNIIDSIASFLVGAFSTAFTTAKAVVVWLAESLIWLWEKLQAVWDFTRGLREEFGNIASVATSVLVVAFNLVRDAVATVTSWFQALWDKSEGLRSLLVGAFGAAVGAIQTSFEQLRAAVDWLWSSIQRVIDAAQTAIDFVSRIPGLPGSQGSAADAIRRQQGAPMSGVSGGTRDSGGPALAGKSYLIGVPEILTMGSQSGHITPLSKLGGGNTITVVVQGRATREDGQAVVDALNRWVKSNGPLPALVTR